MSLDRPNGIVSSKEHKRTISNSNQGQRLILQQPYHKQKQSNLWLLTLRQLLVKITQGLFRGKNVSFLILVHECQSYDIMC